MELRHLRYFVAVAEEGHVTRAAARLGMQQPPLSQQIRALEAELGVTLFERTARSIQLNEAGKSFLKDAKALLASADASVARLKRVANGEEGKLTVGCTSSALLHGLPPYLFEQFRTRYPQVDFCMTENATKDLFDALLDERIDMAFVRSSASRYPGLNTICLHQEPMVVALPRNHHLATAAVEALSLIDLAGEDVVAYRRADGPGIHDALMAACHRAGFNAHIVEEVPRLITAITMVAAGRGIALVPKSLKTIQASRVIYRHLDAVSAFSVPLNLAYRQGSTQGPVGHFLKIAQMTLSSSAHEILSQQE